MYKLVEKSSVDEEIIREINIEVRQIEKEMTEISEIMTDLSLMIGEQAEGIQLGVEHVEHAKEEVEKSVTSLEKGYFESGMRVLHLIKNSFTTYGVGVFYRYGPYQKPNPIDNLAVKLVLSIKL